MIFYFLIFSFSARFFSHALGFPSDTILVWIPELISCLLGSYLLTWLMNLYCHKACEFCDKWICLVLFNTSSKQKSKFNFSLFKLWSAEFSWVFSWSKFIKKLWFSRNSICLTDPDVLHLLYTFFFLCREFT